MIIGMHKTPIRSLQVDPTSECNARCPMCPRHFGSTPYRHSSISSDEISVEELTNILNMPFFSEVENMLINGNYGDLVMHSNPKEFIKVIVDKEIPTITIFTNGAAQSTDFWSWLGKQPGIFVEFSIDGLQDTHSIYRRNTRFDTVIRNAKEFIESGGNAIWTMILFKHNQHQVDECYNLSKELGFTTFKSKPTTRFKNNSTFNVYDKNFELTNILEPTDILKEFYENKSYQKIYSPDDLKNMYNSYEYSNKEWKDSETNFYFDIYCDVAEKGHCYISHDMKLWPCCFTQIDHDSSIRAGIKNQFMKKFYDEKGLTSDFNSLRNNSIDSIIENGLFRETEDSWNGDCFSACAINCVKNSKLNLQYNMTKKR